MDSSGYPNLDFEEWYQQGLSCYKLRMPRSLVRQAFYHLGSDWKRRGKRIEFWHIRAFVYGLNGQDTSGTRNRIVADDFRWPSPPDESWQWVVCIYPDGKCDVDLVHPVSRRFWSEDHGFIDLPNLDRSWFERMGFAVMQMNPLMKVALGAARKHLRVVK